MLGLRNEDFVHICKHVTSLYTYQSSHWGSSRYGSFMSASESESELSSISETYSGCLVWYGVYQKKNCTKTILIRNIKWSYHKLACTVNANSGFELNIPVKEYVTRYFQRNKFSIDDSQKTQFTTRSKKRFDICKLYSAHVHSQTYN